MLGPLKDAAYTTLRRLGYEVVRYPPRATLASHLKTLLAVYRVNCVIDAGANRGQYGRLLRGIGFRGRIVSFEPVSQSHAALLQASRGDPQWRAEHLALGSRAGLASINVTGDPCMCSFLKPSEFAIASYGALAGITSTEDVQVARLDDLFEDVVAGIVEPRVYLKMDTQGFDFEVLAGAAQCLDRIVALQTEVAVKRLYQGMRDYREVISYLEARGFELSGMYPVGRDERDLTAIEFDCVMVRPGSLD